MRSNLPEARLGDPGIASIILGQSPPSHSYNQAKRGLPFYQGKADFGLVHPHARIWCDIGQQFGQKNDILISVRAPVGDVNISDTDCVIGRGVTAIRAGKRIDPWFLFFALQFAKPEIESFATGSTFASINKSTILDIKIPCPTVTEQITIAKRLREVITGIIQEESIIGCSMVLKRAAMRKLFTRGLRGEAQKETEIGLVPESWHITTLSHVAQLSTGTTPATKHSEFFIGTIPFIKTTDIINNRISSSTTFVSKQAVIDYNLEVYKPGTVLMAMYGQGKTRGQVAILDIPATTTQNAAAIEPNENLFPAFLWHFLMSSYERLRNMGSLGHISHLNLGYLRELLIPLPSLHEQLEIVEILDAIDRKIELHKKKKALLEELFKSLLHKLMTGEIRVADLDLSAIEKAVDEGSGS
jgi:type I restriction enzyme S subunit